MESDAFKGRIKEIIATVANIDESTIGDDSHFIDDLGLDSLSLLEIGVDIDYEYKLGVEDDEFKTISSVTGVLALIERVLASKAPAVEVA